MLLVLVPSKEGFFNLMIHIQCGFGAELVLALGDSDLFSADSQLCSSGWCCTAARAAADGAAVDGAAADGVAADGAQLIVLQLMVQ